MPGRDRTGPSGSGPASGRGMGPCGTGAGRGQGMGMGRGRGFGRGFGGFSGRRAAAPEQADEQKILEEQNKAIQRRLDELKGE